MVQPIKGKVVITACLTGAFLTKDLCPYVPLTPEEIGVAAADCYQEGAAIAHIHARDENGVPTGSKDVFMKIHEEIRKHCNIILQDSTGGGPNLTLAGRIECIEAQPEMASLNMGSLMRVSGPYAGTAMANLPNDLEDWAAKMRERKIKPEMECFNTAMYRDVRNLIKKELLEPPYYIDIVLGMKYQGGLEATPQDLAVMKMCLPDNCLYNVAAVGAGELPITTMAMAMGSGFVRVGLEDNTMYSKGVPAKSSAELVARTVRIARELGLEPATPEEARDLLKLTNHWS